MTRMSSLIANLVLIGVCFVLSGCPEETLCETDYECKSREVCEPEGCRDGCERHQDCIAPELCLTRQVEEGKACKSP